MPFIEVKATTSTGELFKSKAAMKRAIDADPRKVQFTSVPSLGPTWYGTAQEFGWSDRAKAGLKLTVVGPDPQTSRKWYGTIEVKNGKLKAS